MHPACFTGVAARPTCFTLACTNVLMPRGWNRPAAKRPTKTDVKHTQKRCKNNYRSRYQILRRAQGSSLNITSSSTFCFIVSFFLRTTNFGLTSGVTVAVIATTTQKKQLTRIETESYALLTLTILYETFEHIRQ